jgi:hypothetical protein
VFENRVPRGIITGSWSKDVTGKRGSVCMYVYTGCPGRNVKNFGSVFLMLKYADITKYNYIQN